MAEHATLRETEAWFVRHGLPYFVDERRARARRGLSRPVFLPVLAFAALVGVVVGFVAARVEVSDGVVAGVVATLVVLGGYGLLRLNAGPMARWAVARTLSSLGLLFPLVTRALPLLLLFVTFLFINTEVWQVATTLDGGVLWVTVLLFAALAIAFLLVRLPEELDRVDDEIGGERLAAACAGTPLEAAARRYVDRDVTDLAQMKGFAKGNLVFVLLVSQAVQVLLLSVAVYLFFVLFGSVAIREEVMVSWLGKEPQWVIPGWEVLSLELLQVSTFLAAFSGLYFTVYAVSDETYRRQFFTSLVDQLERAVGVRVVYQLLQQEKGLSPS